MKNFTFTPYRFSGRDGIKITFAKLPTFECPFCGNANGTFYCGCVLE